MDTQKVEFHILLFDPILIGDAAAHSKERTKKYPGPVRLQSCFSHLCGDERDFYLNFCKWK